MPPVTSRAAFSQRHVSCCSFSHTSPASVSQQTQSTTQPSPGNNCKEAEQGLGKLWGEQQPRQGRGIPPGRGAAWGRAAHSSRSPPGHFPRGFQQEDPGRDHTKGKQLPGVSASRSLLLAWWEG